MKRWSFLNCQNNKQNRKTRCFTQKSGFEHGAKGCRYSRIHWATAAHKNVDLSGGSIPGLVVIGGDSLSRGCGFESQHQILDGHFFTLICCKNAIVFLRKTENKLKRGRDGQFKKPWFYLIST